MNAIDHALNGRGQLMLNALVDFAMASKTQRTHRTLLWFFWAADQALCLVILTLLMTIH